MTEKTTNLNDINIHILTYFKKKLSGITKKNIYTFQFLKLAVLIFFLQIVFLYEVSILLK